MKKVRYWLLTVVAVILVFLIYVLNKSCPIITGYAAKSMCSEFFLAHRDPSKIAEEDLQFFPISFAKTVINTEDSSVTATLLGLWKQKAIFRKGIGSTLVHDISEQVLREQANHFYRWQPVNRDSIDWPLGDRITTTNYFGVDKDKLAAAVHDFFAEADTGSKKNTRALIIVYNGQVIAEKYAGGFTQKTPMLGWSMGKSIGSALFGVLHKQRLVELQQPMSMRAWKNNPADPRNRITVRNVLQQASGLAFEENYRKSSDATIMLYRQADMGNFTAGHPLSDTPGTHFYYSSGNANLLSLKMRELVGDSNYYVFPYSSFLHRIGMYNTIPEPDASGTFVLSSYVYASARDWARFGLLYLNNGRCNGEQVLDSDWVSQSATPCTTTNFNHYGYQFWLNRGNDPRGVYRAFPHAPADMYYASGFQGQEVFIIPSKHLVVVRLGISEQPDYGADHSLSLLMEAVK